MYLYPQHPAHAESLELGEGGGGALCRWCTVLGNEKGGLARKLMGSEKAIRLGRKAGEVVWKGMIGGKEEFR